MLDMCANKLINMIYVPHNLVTEKKLNKCDENPPLNSSIERRV